MKYKKKYCALISMFARRIKEHTIAVRFLVLLRIKKHTAVVCSWILILTKRASRKQLSTNYVLFRSDVKFHPVGQRLMSQTLLGWTVSQFFPEILFSSSRCCVPLLDYKREGVNQLSRTWWVLVLNHLLCQHNCCWQCTSTGWDEVSIPVLWDVLHVLTKILPQTYSNPRLVSCKLR